MTIQIDDTNYSYYKKLFEVIWLQLSRQLPPSSPEADPLAMINTLELKSSAKARRALSMGLHDFISQVKHFPPDVRRMINEQLAANQFPNLTVLSGVKDKVIAGVLKRKQINDLDEYSILKEEVIDLAANLSAEQRKFLDRMLADFESFGNRDKGM